jgi:hypothetical protein
LQVRSRINALTRLPGLAGKNGGADIFQPKLVDAFLTWEPFASETAARQQPAMCQEDSSFHWPHRSLACATPAEFAAHRWADDRAAR